MSIKELKLTTDRSTSQVTLIFVWVVLFANFDDSKLDLYDAIMLFLAS